MGSSTWWIYYTYLKETSKPEQMHFKQQMQGLPMEKVTGSEGGPTNGPFRK